MKQVRQLPDAVGQARRRAGVVRVAVHGHCRARQRELRRARGGLPDVEAARPDDHELRLEREHLGPARRAGGLPGATENVLAAGELDHLGEPVPGAERRVDPFGKEDASRRQPADGAAACSIVSSIAAASSRRARRRRAGTRESERIRPPRRACADRATGPPRRPGRPIRARRSRPRRPRTGPASRSRRGPGHRSGQRRPCTASGRREPTREPLRRSPGSSGSPGRSAPRSRSACRRPRPASDTLPRHRRESRSGPDRRSSRLHSEGTNRCALRLDSRQT